MATLEMLFDFGPNLKDLLETSQSICPNRKPRRCLISVPCRGTPRREQDSPAQGSRLLNFFLCIAA